MSSKCSGAGHKIMKDYVLDELFRLTIISYTGLCSNGNYRVRKKKIDYVVEDLFALPTEMC